MDQLTRGDLARLLEACDLQVHSLRFRAKLAEEEVEKFHRTVRADRMLETRDKIQASLTSGLNE
jgi:hypothetical protein